jgi:hypothetical protein
MREINLKGLRKPRLGMGVLKRSLCPPIVLKAEGCRILT